MKRREFIALLGTATVAGPRTTVAQQQTGRRIGFLSPQSVSSAAHMLLALREGLRDLGWVEGQNITFELRYADGAIDRLPQLATELVSQKLDVIVAGSSPGVLAAKQATGKVPIVMVTTGDPIAGGLVQSLARPGANVTGVTSIAQELSAKRLELLKEAAPGIRRVATLANPDSPYTARFMKDAQLAARSLDVELQPLEARGPEQFEAVFAAMRGSNAQALMVNADIMFITHRTRIVELAAKNRLPSVYWERAFVSAGGLMFYGADLRNMYRHAAIHVDKVLKGAKPAELPVEQPTKLELVINLNAAKMLGLNISPVLLARADEVIE